MCVPLHSTWKCNDHFSIYFIPKWYLYLRTLVCIHGTATWSFSTLSRGSRAVNEASRRLHREPAMASTQTVLLPIGWPSCGVRAVRACIRVPFPLHTGIPGENNGVDRFFFLSAAFFAHLRLEIVFHSYQVVQQSVHTYFYHACFLIL